MISIHALLAESDRRNQPGNRAILAISIHALLAESDVMADALNMLAKVFLSTLSLRRATWRLWGLFRGRNFYPRSPCGERPGRAGDGRTPKKFLSTLSLRRATTGCEVIRQVYPFLSTLSLRRATRCAHRRGGLAGISIHALLAESDCM